jgi:hypothetical protein
MIGIIMKLFDKIPLKTLSKNILLVISWSLFLLQFKNYSHFSEYLIIPLITSLTAKYLIGDLDKGYKYTSSDILYWITLIFSSISTVFLYHKFIKTNK